MIKTTITVEVTHHSYNAAWLERQIQETLHRLDDVKEVKTKTVEHKPAN
ncbi:hypothetical protein GZH47_33445 (plasmid) [Paenibacillus rhizovicinus]|uniref:Uncharacterized protein n=1 Tax=Paenibacillus rhizovicinus TaxID=2704463 RepID=A0A6C0PB41_9BACL|nr:hypothetical protein [Paenibacillus rhizovicinus]QHW35800.1 hypothetical protein GZH47_33445 [Paenibacillus rhizovicinus]